MVAIQIKAKKVKELALLKRRAAGFTVLAIRSCTYQKTATATNDIPHLEACLKEIDSSVTMGQVLNNSLT